MNNPLEKLVPTLEQCQALAPYWGERETVFFWYFQPECDHPVTQELIDEGWFLRAETQNPYYTKSIPAPTMQELWDALPVKIRGGYWKELTASEFSYLRYEEEYRGYELIQLFTIEEGPLPALVRAFIELHELGLMG